MICVGRMHLVIWLLTTGTIWLTHKKWLSAFKNLTDYSPHSSFNVCTNPACTPQTIHLLSSSHQIRSPFRDSDLLCRARLETLLCEIAGNEEFVKRLEPREVTSQSGLILSSGQEKAEHQTAD